MPDTALVAGGNGGAGPAVVAALEDDGWRVVVPSRASGYDLTQPESARRAVEEAEALGAVVNMVGGFSAGPRLHELAPPEFERMLTGHLGVTLNLAHAALPALLSRGGGAFLAFSARAAERPFRGGAAYSTAKAAVLALVRALDADYRADGLRANALLPGTIDTSANREAMPGSDRSGWTAPEEIAELVRFLVSERGRGVRGAAIPV